MVNNVHNLGNKTFNLLFYFYICIIIYNSSLKIRQA